MEAPPDRIGESPEVGTAILYRGSLTRGGILPSAGQTEPMANEDHHM